MSDDNAVIEEVSVAEVARLAALYDPQQMLRANGAEILAAQKIQALCATIVQLRSDLDALTALVARGDADQDRMSMLQRLCGMRRRVELETTSLGTTISARNEQGGREIMGNGSGARDALDHVLRLHKERRVL